VAPNTLLVGPDSNGIGYISSRNFGITTPIKANGVDRSTDGDSKVFPGAGPSPRGGFVVVSTRRIGFQGTSGVTSGGIGSTDVFIMPSAVKPSVVEVKGRLLVIPMARIG